MWIKEYERKQLEHPSMPSILNGMVGRPHLEVPYEQLSFLIENRFSVLKLLTWLVYQYGPFQWIWIISSQYASITILELDAMVSEIQHQFPMCGNRQMQGHFLSRGNDVQQSHIRESQQRVDPDRAIIRHLHVLNGRKYLVPSPCSRYHIDGHHKVQ